MEVELVAVEVTIRGRPGGVGRDRRLSSPPTHTDLFTKRVFVLADHALARAYLKWAASLVALFKQTLSFLLMREI